MIMSERDSVHKEIEKLQEEVTIPFSVIYAIIFSSFPLDMVPGEKGNSRTAN